MRTLPVLTASLALACALAAVPRIARADSAQRPGALVIAIDPVQSEQIEMPDASVADYGAQIQSSLTTQFTNSGQYIITSVAGAARLDTDPAPTAAMSQVAPGDYQWNASVTPVATIHIQVDALGFETGFGGEHMFYGFNERFRTPFNDGSLTYKNEFPLKQVEFDPNWFDSFFNDQGSAPFDSQSGLDLGDGFGINVLFAYVSLKYASYQSDLHLTVTADSPLLGLHNVTHVLVTGNGYFYDFSGGYEQYSAGIAITRKDAMGQALANAISASYSAIEQMVAQDPLLAKIDAIVADGSVLMGTGPNSGVAVGTQYQPQGVSGVIVQVVQSTSIGSVGKVVQGSVASLAPGMILQQAGTSASELASRELASVGLGQEQTVQVSVPDTNLPQADLGNLQPDINWAQAAVDSVVDAITLGYRISRYFDYDQPYNEHPDGYENQNTGGGSVSNDFSVWFPQAASSAWGTQIGLNSVFNPGDIRQEGASTRSGPVIAVIDTGVDYNHPLLHPSLWLNPSPVTDPSGTDSYGWDFISNDSRPYDDGYHGTQMASAALLVAPNALILPLKVFNPYGVTSSAALYGAFQYAVDHGANVILCGWATRKSSVALEMGVAYAQSHGVLVVAAAGDRGDDLSKTPAYPASLAKNYDNVLTVTGVDTSDKLVVVPGEFANFDPATVGIAAPGQNIQVAEPRSGEYTAASTGIAAALVAGAAVRTGAADYTGMKAALLQSAKVVPGLASSVSGGRRLYLSQ